MTLASTYFGPVQWYTKVRQCAGPLYIEAHETFPKQTYRNRCVIASPQGAQQLSVPVEGSSAKHQLIRDLRISEHGNWRRLHWQALQTAYGYSPFFEYYQDDLRPFFFDCGPSSPFHMHYLLDYNMATADFLCRMIGLEADFRLTEEYVPAEEDAFDLRTAIRPKNAPADPDFTPQKYYQVYQQRHGFLPNLSALDLLFNEGPQAILKL